MHSVPLASDPGHIPTAITAPCFCNTTILPIGRLERAGEGEAMGSYLPSMILPASTLFSVAALNGLQSGRCWRRRASFRFPELLPCLGCDRDLSVQPGISDIQLAGELVRQSGCMNTICPQSRILTARDKLRERCGSCSTRTA